MNGFSFVNILDVNADIREIVRQWRNKEEIRKWMITQSIISHGEHAYWLKNLSDRSDSKFWVVFLGEVPIGAVYLQNIDYANKISEWGFYIGEEKYKGKGLSKRILFYLLEKVFDEMNFDILLTKVLSNNDAAIYVYKKFNFNKKDQFTLNNKKEFILFEFTRNTWEKIKKS